MDRTITRIPRAIRRGPRREEFRESREECSPPRSRVSRLIDLTGAVVGLVLFAPVLIICAAAIRLHLGSPVLFRQQRPGLHGRPFTILKFRTMRQAVDRAGRPLPDAERLTRLGRILRSTSLDELPELWNVLRGDMSLVGPRPLLMEYLDLYTPEQAVRHTVRPGITGWAQINGRNALSWDEKFAMDAWYIEHKTVWLDMKILLRTATRVFARDGISHAGHATMERFRGPARTRLLIWGAGGHAKVVADAAHESGIEVVGFVDRALSRVGERIDGSGGRIVCAEAALMLLAEGSNPRLPAGADNLAFGIGDNRTRFQCLNRVSAFRLPIIRHPSSVVSKSSRIGAGTVICAHVVVNPGAVLGKACIINTGAIVEHDCTLGDAVHVSPGAVLSGGVTVGDRTWIGAGATVIQGIRIGHDSIIGAGAVIIRDVPSGVTIVGNPGRSIRENGRASTVQVDLNIPNGRTPAGPAPLPVGDA
jgi:sugar O-acyltransferase (sialic acid O-acetyltransferase NeuD family)